MKNLYLLVALAVLMPSCVSQQGASGVIQGYELDKNKTYNTGYGEISESHRTGATQTVDAAKTIIPLETYLRALSGVSVQGNGRDAVITIRGVSSFMASNEPLFLLDNLEIGGGFRAIYDLVNPVEIASVTVLKDPSETGLYGSRGSNGIILINLKKYKEK